MRVLTWNLWWRFGPWEPRQVAIRAELGAAAPDIAFLQEVWATDERDQGTELAEVTGLQLARTKRLTGEREGQPQEFGNAILSRWPMEVLEQVALPGPTGEPSHRSALAVRVDAPGGPLLAVVTHLEWRYNESLLRQQQLADVVALVDRHRVTEPEPAAALLGGDFNAVPESDEIRRLTGLAEPYNPGLVFTDVWTAVGDGLGHTWTRDNPNASEALWPRRRLDYVFVSWPRPKPYANPLTAELVGVDAHDGYVASDHYGVLAELDDRTTLEKST